MVIVSAMPVVRSVRCEKSIVLSMGVGMALESDGWTVPIDGAVGGVVSVAMESMCGVGFEVLGVGVVGFLSVLVFSDLFGAGDVVLAVYTA